MKKQSKKLSRFIALLLTLVLVVNYIPATGNVLAEENSEKDLVFNAYEDYSNTTNPNGQWSYQYRVNTTTNTFNNLNSNQNINWINSVSDLCAAIMNVTTDNITGNPALEIAAHNQTAEVSLTFTAPYSGEVSIRMANGGVFAPAAPAASGVRFKIMHNSNIIEEKSNVNTDMDNDVSTWYFTGALKVTVNEGDTIRFLVGRNAAINGKTYFNPEITYTQFEDKKLVFNGHNDFSADENPNLPWKYQYRVMENDSYVYYDLTKDTREGVVDTWNTNDYAAIEKTQGDQVTSLTNDILCLAPWTNSHQAVLTFVAPYSGKINISMTNGGIYSPYQSADGVSFWLLQNESEIMSVNNLDSDYNTAGNRLFVGTETITVKEGDIIRFVVGRNSEIDGRTYMNPQIIYISFSEKVMPVYNAYADFSTESNPNLPWQYKCRVLENGNYVYYDMTNTATSSTTDANLTGQWSITGAAISKTKGDKVISNSCDIIEMAPHSNTHQAVLSFFAPYSGVIDISMTNGGVFAPYQSVGGVSFWLLHNGTEVQYVSDLDFDYNTAGNRFFDGTETLTVDAGDDISFVVGRNDSIDGRTYFNPQIEYVSVDDMNGIPIWVDSLNDIEVGKGTLAEELPLPKTVDVKFSDASIKQVDVTWDTTNYSSEIGTYVLKGDLIVGNNPKNLSVEVTVQVVAEGSIFKTYTIWESGELDNVLAFHQFGLSTTSKGTVIASAETRDSYSDTDGGHDIVIKRSSDGGKTWGDTIFVASRNEIIEEETNHTFASPSLVEDAESGKLFCFYARLKSGAHKVFYKTSTDDGLTWSSTVEITDLFADDPHGRTRHTVAPGHGIQIQNGTHAGRILVYMVHDTGHETDFSLASMKFGVSVIYSDDGGDTWKNSAYSAASGVCEGRIGELDDGTLVLSCRNAAIGTTSENYRYQMISTDGGETWSEDKPWKSIGTLYSCDAGVYTDIQDGYTRMFFSSLESGNPIRNNLQIRLSYDNGSTWSFHKEIWRDETITGGNGDGNNDIVNAGTGSSDVSKISDGTYGVVHGTKMTNTRVELIVFNLAWITDGKSDAQILKELKPLKNSFDAYDDFSDTNNPNLPWKYQHRVMKNGEYEYHDMNRISETQWGYDGAAIIKTQGDQVLSSTCDILQLVAHNTTDQAVLTFVAPYDGEIYIQMENHAIFAPHNSEQGASFTLLHNEEEIVPKTLLDSTNSHTSRVFTGTEALNVKAGDVIRFVVGREADVNAATYFNPDITYTRIDMPGANRDINGDRVITEIDANEMRKVLVGSSEINFYDVNEDTACDVKDLVSEKKYLDKIK